jgi:hypothetical protein
MASILKVDTITGVSTAGSIAVTGEGNSTTTNLQQGLCKAWTNINGSSGTPAARDSFNNGSITDNAAGDYTLSFTSSFGNANYTHVGMGGNGSTALRTPCQQTGDHAPATGSCRYQLIVENASAAVDGHFFGVENLGDLA